MISSSAAGPSPLPRRAAAYLKDGLPPNAPWGIDRRAPAAGQAQGDAFVSCGEGPRDFYEGDLARSIASDVQAGGGSLSVEDLAGFRAHLRPPLIIPYRGGNVSRRRS